ncbi:MAG TPA: DUF3987 domain-containing protein, partial [Prolixibacteraceae bacterium]|nr:DUF3987 domain-containing protein [Prolixibacteraceae bacterium]
MNQHNTTPAEKSLQINQFKDNKINRLNPTFDYKGTGIDVEDIKAEADLLAQQDQESYDKQAYRFPVEAFPVQVRQIITETNECLKFPIDFTGASLLFAASISIGNTYKVQVKRGFQESAVLFMALVSPPGTTKSHPLSFAIQPIKEEDIKSYKLFEEQKMEFENKSRLSKKQLEEEGFDEVIKPVWKKMLLTDFTPEALALVHKFNQRGLGVYVDEFAAWFKNFNRYNRGSEMESWLSIWSGKPINVDRKGGEPVFIPFPFVSVGGTIQTGILNELAKDSRNQNGFIDRILFVTLNS